MAPLGDGSDAAEEAIATHLEKRPISTVVIIIGKAIKIRNFFLFLSYLGHLRCWVALGLVVLPLDVLLMLVAAVFSYAD